RSGETQLESGEFTLAGNHFYLASQEPLRRGAALFWLHQITRVNDGAPGLAAVGAEAGVEVSHQDPLLLRALAEAQIAAGDSGRALATLELLHRRETSDVFSAALLADLLRARGDARRAR